MGSEIATWVKQTLKNHPLVVFNVGGIDKKQLKVLIDHLSEFSVEVNEDKDMTVKRK